jgi:hypothetical protein
MKRVLGVGKGKSVSPGPPLEEIPLDIASRHRRLFSVGSLTNIRCMDVGGKMTIILACRCFCEKAHFAELRVFVT